jgi:threonine-phosphate decarboxylase
VTTSPIQHGGNQYAIRKRLKLGDRPLLDVSVSLNPLGPPKAALEAARKAMDRAWQYPEPGNPRLVERLAAMHDVGPEHVFVGSGTSEIISLLAQSLRESLKLHAAELGDPRLPLAHLVEPIYSEYRRASLLNELRVEPWSKHHLAWSVEFLPRSARGIYWTGNPVSPMGHVWDRDTLLRLVDDSEGLLTVVDEAYLPFYPDEARRTVVQAAVRRKNLCVLRSVTKIYAFPGLRVGYAVASADLVRRLRQFQNPWSVDSAAEAALIAALDDDEYLERTYDVVGSQAAMLCDRIWDIPGLRPAWPDRVRPSDAAPPPNWVLVSLTDTAWDSVQLQEALARRGIYARECSNFSGLEPGAILTGHGQIVPTRGHLRLAVRTAAENEKVLRALSELMASSPERCEVLTAASC